MLPICIVIRLSRGYNLDENNIFLIFFNGINRIKFELIFLKIFKYSSQPNPDGFVRQIEVQ